LAQRFRVAGFTRRGHGRSERPDSGYDIETLVEDIRRYFDFLGIERATLVGHSWAGLEMPRFATKYPKRVHAVIYLDAVNVLLDPRPDPAADPVWAVLETRPRPEDQVTPDAYLAYIKRSRPDLASIWCEAIEADRLDEVRRLVLHGPATATVASMEAGLGTHRDPAYGDVVAPSLALVLGAATHPFIPPNATEALRGAANDYYRRQFVPWLKRRTALFIRAVPAARIVELDTSNHTLFIAKEDETVNAIFEFLGRP
jgi:pimeloyl-ACP methyl ester carboxylesterase